MDVRMSSANCRAVAARRGDGRDRGPLRSFWSFGDGNRRKETTSHLQRRGRQCLGSVRDARDRPLPRTPPPCPGPAGGVCRVLGRGRRTLGSTYYVDHPSFRSAARWSCSTWTWWAGLCDERLYIRGRSTANGWGGLLQQINLRHGLALDMPPDSFGNSDQLSFYAKRVPILGFFTGRHKDYHEPSDKFDRLNIPGMRRVTRFAEEVAEAVADSPARPEYLAVVPPESRDEPYFGAFCDFTRRDAGFGIGPVVQGGPADRGGLRRGTLSCRWARTASSTPSTSKRH